MYLKLATYRGYKYAVLDFFALFLQLFYPNLVIATLING